MPSYLVLTTLPTQPELLAHVAPHLPESAATNLISSVNEPSTSPTIEQVRTMLEATHFTSSSSGKGMTWLLWNIQASSIPAQNALLKLLEEPPVDTTLLLTTPTLEGILPTIQSRCTVIKLTDTDASTRLDTTVDTETIADLYQQLCSENIPNLIALAEKFGTADEAALILKKLTSWLHQQPEFPNTVLTHHLKLLSQAHAALAANANPRLTLEHCFFEIHKQDS